MREDPILYEDWKIEISPYIQKSTLHKFDAFLSHIFFILQILNGIILRSATHMFIWIFLWIIFFILENYINAVNSKKSNRLLSIMVLLIVSVILNYGLYHVYIHKIQIISGFIIGIKLLIIPLSTISEESRVLLPKNEYSNFNMQSEIDALVSSNFEIPDIDAYREIEHEYRKTQYLNIIVVSIIIITEGVSAFYFTDYGIHIILPVIIMSLTTIMLNLIMITWFIIKQKERKKKLQDKTETKEHKVETFAKIEHVI